MTTSTKKRMHGKQITEAPAARSSALGRVFSKAMDHVLTGRRILMDWMLGEPALSTRRSIRGANRHRGRLTLMLASIRSAFERAQLSRAKYKRRNGFRRNLSANLEQLEGRAMMAINVAEDFSSWTGGGFQPTPTAGQLSSNFWAVTGWSDGALAFGGTRTTANTDYTRGATTAAVSTGGMYSFSGTGIPSGNALLIQPGGNDWAPGTLTFRSQNTGSAAIDPVISYDLYVRNDQSRSNSFNFSFSTDNINYTSVAALNYTSPAAAVGTAITFVSRWQPF
jgi:hypothetical protein